MSETIFKDRRSDADRREDNNAGAVLHCRRRVRNRRRENASMPPSEWWLNVNYTGSDR